MIKPKKPRKVISPRPGEGYGKVFQKNRIKRELMGLPAKKYY